MQLLYIFFVGGAVPSWLSAFNFGSSGPGCSPGWGCCFGFLGKACYSQYLSINAGGNPTIDLASHPGEKYKYCQLLHATGTRINSGLGHPLAHIFACSYIFRRGNIPRYAGCVLFSAHHPSHSKEPQPKACTTARIHRYMYCEMGFTFFKV